MSAARAALAVVGALLVSSCEGPPGARVSAGGSDAVAASGSSSGGGSAAGSGAGDDPGDAGTDAPVAPGEAGAGGAPGVGGAPGAGGAPDAGSAEAGGGAGGGDDGPVAIALYQDAPAGIVVDSTYVYWANFARSGTVVKCPIVGGCFQVPWLLTAGARYPNSIAVDATVLYFTSSAGGVIEMTPLDGGGELHALVSGQSPWSIAIDSSDIYWSNLETGEVMKCALGGCGNAPTTLVPGPGSASALTIALDETSVYYTTASQSVMRVPKEGGSPTVLASEQSDPRGLALDETSVYWTNNIDGGSVMRVPKEGGSPTALASAQDRPYGIAVDGTHVYWTNSVLGGSVMKAPVEGGTPVVIASDQERPYGIAVDGTHVYWTNHAVGGSVMKAPK